ncbi:MAG: chorismate-binding protein [Saprospiraceae bacterium]|nr:chorismate-binding protein [Saprospiraceae bacterium]
MMKVPIRTKTIQLLSDTTTPVNIFLKVRDRFLSPCLLESNDYRAVENSNSIIGFEPLASATVRDGKLVLQLPAGERRTIQLTHPMHLAEELKSFMRSFTFTHEGLLPPTNGLIGHTNFDAVQYFDTLKFPADKREVDIPDVHYILYRFLININHFQEQLTLIENRIEGEESRLDEVQRVIFNQSLPTYGFELVGDESSNLTDQEYMDLVTKGKHHCQIGDVFQIVLSRRFAQPFRGDEFAVYRVLRSVNPSPYLYYFDYGAYRIFGSSPESQLVIKEGVARVNPIAGTYRRTGDDDEDAIKAQELAQDPKENAEHVMLVDLARNDLGRHCSHVEVKELKEIQYFSHVIHLVSKVEGDLPQDSNPVEIFGDTFPAGTLSGAPKYKAIELINEYEKTNRSFYGGGIGLIDFNGNVNHAIIIRSFLSLNHVLYSQAGAGIVSESKEMNELQEVNNKLGALKRALELATQLGQNGMS